MHRQSLRRLLSCLVLLLLVLLASCKKKELWQTDFDAALKAAQMQEKELFVLFSGEDWDGKTTSFRVDVLDTDEFREFVKEDYVLLNVDLSEAEQAMALPRADANEQEKADAALLQKGIDAKIDVIRRYGVSNFPCVYILSKEGYVLSIVQYNENLNAPSVLTGIYEEQADGMLAISSAISRMQMATGVEKVRAIDSLYEATPEAGRKPLAGLVKEVPSLDPGDESGLVGKYEFIKTYDEAMEKISEGHREGVVESFIEIAEHGHLDAARKLEAYYNAAYLMALFGESDYDKMYELLVKAQESDPESIRMDDISNLMTMVSKFRELMEQGESLFPGLNVNAD